MPTELPKVPKVFISYSWTSPEHEARIVGWAERIVSDGVDVVLDKWNLKEGQDKYAFMEKMVTDPSISKFLVFSDRGHAQKADARKGGVGTESQIISREIYEKVDQDKFLPIVCEFDEAGKPFLPTFLKSRIHFDFSSPETFHDNYERLIRAIYGKPLYKKPPVGKPPEYILADTGIPLWSKPILQNFKDAVMQDKSHYRGYAATFLETFFERLEDFRIVPDKEKQFDDQVVQSIEAFLPFRDHFVEFLTTVVLYKSETELHDRIAEFFERVIYYKFRPKEMNSWNDWSFDNYYYILYELFIYLTAVLVKHRRFNELAAYLDKAYYLPENADSRDDPFTYFTVFRAYCQSLKARDERLQMRRLSPIADLMKQRATIKALPFDLIMQAEGVLFLRSLIDKDRGRPWFPHTLLFGHYSKTLELFARAAVHKEFERLKIVFGVSNREELLQKAHEGGEAWRVGQWNEFNYARVGLDYLLGLDKLDSVK